MFLNKIYTRVRYQAKKINLSLHKYSYDNEYVKVFNLLMVKKNKKCSPGALFVFQRIFKTYILYGIKLMPFSYEYKHLNRFKFRNH